MVFSRGQRARRIGRRVFSICDEGQESSCPINIGRAARASQHALRGWRLGDAAPRWVGEGSRAQSEGCLDPARKRRLVPDACAECASVLRCWPAGSGSDG